MGLTSQANYLSVKAGKSGIRVFEPGSHGIPDGFTASLIDDAVIGDLRAEQNTASEGDALANMSRFELLALSSARKALQASSLDVEKHKVVLILSTTKGDVESLANVSHREPYLADVAHKIALSLGNHVNAIVVCNACISGLSAIILANRLIDAGEYEAAIVCGCDCPDRFIISGFQSLKALSTSPCRPFDMERFGLNLGEAAATLVLANTSLASLLADKNKQKEVRWNLHHGFVKNDAFHVTSPAKDGIGLRQALMETLQGVEIADLSFVNAHGTATLFNDQMESVAIEKAGLSLVPTNALKGYFGHTLGAAGILETIVSMRAADDSTILATRGFEELGVSGKINMIAENRSSDKTSFIKMLSGFGGCNASLLAERDKCPLASSPSAHTPLVIKQTHRVKITPDEADVDGKLLARKGEGDFVTSLYKTHVGSYPKYYKMDALSRLGFVASELLLAAEGEERFVKRNDRAIILCNRSSSICSDRKYLESIQDKDNYFPSPSVFVYTLPNIVTGEIAIRNGYQGETSFYILSENDGKEMEILLRTAFADPQTRSVLGGWLDAEDATRFEAELALYQVER